MNDEKYFLLPDQSVSTNRGFYTSDKSMTPPDVKFKRTRKYEPQILVWIAISEKGISSPFFAEQKQGVNETTYLSECIIQRLMQFIDMYHLKEKVLFWLDLASNHYSNSITGYFHEERHSIRRQEVQSTELSASTTNRNSLVNPKKHGL